jgi:hypothetical protein
MAAPTLRLKRVEQQGCQLSCRSSPPPWGIACRRSTAKQHVLDSMCHAAVNAAYSVYLLRALSQSGTAWTPTTCAYLRRVEACRTSTPAGICCTDKPPRDLRRPAPLLQLAAPCQSTVLGTCTARTQADQPAAEASSKDSPSARGSLQAGTRA